MSRFSMKRGGKEVGPASVYAAPHDMKGRPGAKAQYPTGTEIAGQQRMSVGNIDCCPPEGTKTSGVRTRGNGAATKGTMARGPMG